QNPAYRLASHFLFLAPLAPRPGRPVFAIGLLLAHRSDEAKARVGRLRRATEAVFASLDSPGMLGLAAPLQNSLRFAAFKQPQRVRRRSALCARATSPSIPGASERAPQPAHPRLCREVPLGLTLRQA